MMEIRLLIEGGKATPGPPIGPTLSPLGLPVGKVVADINKATAKYAGMKVPVILRVNPATKEYEIEVGTPPTSALIKKELGIEKGAHSPGEEWVGDISLDKVVEIAKIKLPEMNTDDLTAAVLQVLGTCLSMGVKVEGKDPREVQQAIKAGEIKIG
ncbi:MAG: 50S ribosomal protein L11 [Candidatus Diapherotrites archaeon]|nr:50S ribosomal protein L11 [Candidatus Diapherotrites archaeon]